MTTAKKAIKKTPRKKHPKRRVDSPETKQNKIRLIKAMKVHHGLVSIACQAVGVSTRTYYNYIHNDPKFQVAVDECVDMNLDEVESHLFNQIASGNCASTIFYLKTKGARRGFIEPQHIQDTETDDKLIDIMKTLADKLPS